VTNKHVIQGATGKLVLHGGRGIFPDDQPTGSLHTMTITNFPSLWIDHPTGVDLCAVPLNIITQQAIQNGIQLFVRSLGKSLIQTSQQLQSLNAVEEVIMIGYPNGLWDSSNNYPLVRRGITASHPAIDFNGNPESVVDIAAFPGSSGSPVLIAQEGYTDKFGNMTLGQQRAIFLERFAM